MPEGVNFDKKENQIVVTPATTKRYSRKDMDYVEH